MNIKNLAVQCDMRHTFHSRYRWPTSSS